LDKFYTKPEIAINLIQNIDLIEYDCIIDPSCGNGAFYSNIIHDNKIGIDILPELKSLILQNHGKIDYLEFRNDNDLNKTDEINDHTRIFLAVYMGSTRLIDNAALII
jgi:hypothetical protein